MTAMHTRTFSGNFSRCMDASKQSPKVDVQQLAAVAIQHQVAGVPVAQAQQVAHLMVGPALILD